MSSIVRTFKLNFVEARYTIAVVSVLVVAMRLLMFLSLGIPQNPYIDNSFVWKFIEPLFSNDWVVFAASTLSVFIISWQLSELNNRFTLVRSRSNLPFVVPLFLFSLHPYFLKFTADYISVIIVLFAFFHLLNSYQKLQPQLLSLKISVLIALASVFQIYALALLPLFWIGERKMREGTFRSFLASLIGIILVYTTVFTSFFFFDRIDAFVAPFLSFTKISVAEMANLSVYNWAIVSILLLFFIIYMIVADSVKKNTKVISKVTIQLFHFFILYSLALQIIYWNSTLFFFVFAFVILAYLIAYYYSLTVNKWGVYSAYTVLSLLFIFYLVQTFAFSLPF